MMLTLYFSGTGNSKYIAQRFSEKLSADCHSIEEDVDFAALLAASDTVAVCYPIHGSSVPRMMREFVATHGEALKSKKLIIFCTQMMYSGNGARAFANLLPDCESRVIYAEHFNMPNNISNLWLFPIRDRERIRKKRAADKKLERACPVGNLTQNGSRAEQNKNCMVCYRCVNLCPQKAAIVLFNKKPKRQYKGIVPDDARTK